MHRNVNQGEMGDVSDQPGHSARSRGGAFQGFQYSRFSDRLKIVQLKRGLAVQGNFIQYVQFGLLIDVGL